MGLPKFKFKSAKKKSKFNFITDNGEVFNSEIINGSYIDMYSNEKIILEGCRNIIDYQSDYIRLKLKKGCLIIMGTDFLISSFENENIIIKGNILSLEFLV